MTRTVVHLLRHAEPHNPNGILYGRLTGFPLSTLGHQQARQVAEFLSGRDVTHLVSSSLQRAQQTADPLAREFRLEVLTDDRLIESWNKFEGLQISVGNGALNSPRHWPKLINPFRPSWGEPYLQIAYRMLGAVYHARAVAAGHEAICVSHQLPIWTLRRFLTGQRLWHDPRRRQCAPASLTSLVFDDEVLTKVAYYEPVESIGSAGRGA